MIASYLTAHEKYGYEPIPIFLLARDGRIVADDASRVRFEALDAYLDEKTGKPVARTTRYHYDDGDDAYVVTFTKQRDLVVNTFVEQIKGWRKVAARLSGVDGAYLRFTGDLTPGDRSPRSSATRWFAEVGAELEPARPEQAPPPPPAAATADAFHRVGEFDVLGVGLVLFEAPAGGIHLGRREPAAHPAPAASLNGAFASPADTL